MAKFNAIVTDTWQPTQSLLELLEFLHIEHDGSLESIVIATQSAWLNIDKRDSKTINPFYLAHKDAILAYAKKLGMIDEIKPTQTFYEYGIVLGSDLNETRIRMSYLFSLWEKGISFNKIICLGSERPLDEITENKAKFSNIKNKDHAALPTTEYEMMQWVYHQLDVPEEFKAIPIVFINTPMQKRNGLTQPNTADTLQDWLATQPMPGDCLFISNQPYISYQEAVVQVYLPRSFEFHETCGPALAHYDILELLDTLARFLYQEKMRRAKK